MPRLLTAMCSTVMLVSLAACGDNGSDTGSANDTVGGANVSVSGAPGTEPAVTAPTVTDPAVTEPAVTDPASTEPADTAPATGEPLPAECSLPPVTVIAERVGSAPAGSATLEVVDVVALQIPIVPNPDSTITPADVTALAATTDLLGYSMIFGDQLIPDESAPFVIYGPVEDGKVRGFVSVFPSSAKPLAAGDVITDGLTEGLSIPLPTIGMDLKISTDDTNTYRNSVVGQVEVLALTADTLCLDIDLSWTVNQPTGNTLTIKGVLTGRLIERSTTLTLG